MSPGYMVFLAALAIAQMALPKRLAFIPLPLAACHLGDGEALPELNATRLILLIGLGRAISGKELVWAWKIPLDRIFAVFACACILSALGHKADTWSPSPIAARVGIALNVFGTYLYGRAYIPDVDSFLRFARIMLIMLVPLAVCMLIEMKTGKVLYYVLGANRENSASREDKIRAQGPFRGANTAGCVGATALPLVFISWLARRRLLAIVGAAACMGVTIACNSSGPLSAVGVTLAAIGLWRFRQYLRYLFWGSIFLGIVYFVLKGRGPWYIMASIDLTGGSTGYYRAELIDAGVKHFSEWWLVGTDYTRNWMSTGVSWSPNHTDMTNYYLHLGVIGGLTLTLCLFAMLISSFRLIGRSMAKLREFHDSNESVLWAAGTALAAHAVSFIAISYYDQMHVFFYILLGAIPGLCATAVTATTTSDTVVSPVSVEEAPPPRPLRYYH